MDLVYQSNNGWAINRQDDLFSSDTSWYSIYRYYPESGWTPFKHTGYSLPLCFLWLYRGRFISKDEYLYQVSLLKKEVENGK